jgi:hypothetical protein
VFQFFTSVTGMITAFLGLLGAAVALAASQQGNSGSSTSPPSGMSPVPTLDTSNPVWPPSGSNSTSGDVTQRMNNVCDKLAVDTDTGDAYSALIIAAQSLRDLDVGSVDRASVARAADELDEAAFYINHGQDATQLVTTAVNRLAALGAARCQA